VTLGNSFGRSNKIDWRLLNMHGREGEKKTMSKRKKPKTKKVSKTVYDWESVNDSKPIGFVKQERLNRFLKLS